MTLNLTLRKDVWQITGTVIQDGRPIRIRKSTGLHKSQKSKAKDELTKTYAAVAAGEVKTKSRRLAADAADAFLGRPNSPGTTDQTIMRLFSSALGHVPLHALTLEQIMHHVTSRGNKPNTVARELNSIKAMLSHAESMGWDVPNITIVRPNVDDSRLRWLTESERDHLIDCCDSTIKDVVTFLFYTGARIGEAFALRPQDIHRGSALFTSRKGKTKRKKIRAVPLGARVSSVLAFDDDADFVFTQPDGSQWVKAKFYDNFYNACNVAGIKDFTPHDCRHTFASHLVQKGASLRAVADLLGHSSLAMVMRYSHLAPTHLETTINLLEGE